MAPVRSVTAAGGVLVRQLDGAPHLLAILRRGHWDLPKGKIAPGESVPECAVREVDEELGIDDAEIVAPLAQTVHEYHERGSRMTKTTHWFVMRTRAERFSPQLEEQITEARWIPVADAVTSLGFETLRRLVQAHRDVLARFAFDAPTPAWSGADGETAPAAAARIPGREADPGAARPGAPTGGA